MSSFAFHRIALIAGLFSTNALAQTPPAAPAPAAPAPASFSPILGADRMVTFRVKAANASSVEARGQFSKEPVKLAKGEGDVWTASAGPVDPGVYEYSIVIDGRQMIDPGNPMIKPQREPKTSILHVPGQPPMIWDFQDVPHGAVHQHAYHSKALGRLREMVVYTPPGYGHATAKLPLLVLQHGSGDNQRTWIDHGKAHWILDNLIALKKAVPMVVVMIDGHPLGQVPRGTPGSPRGGALDAFQRELFEDALPLAEAQYAVETTPERRAICGLSMGGNQSLLTGLTHTDRFAWVAGMSSAIRDAEPLKDFLAAPEAANKALRLLWVGCGKDDFLLKDNQKFDALLTEKKITHQYLETEGDHSWPVWRRYLADLAPLLFKDPS